MKKSSRASRMERHYKRKKAGTGLNLVSLMDIFTILVFFLLVNSSDVQNLPNAKSISMPESVAETKPRETVVVLVNNEEILVQGAPVARVEDILESDEIVIPALQAALELETQKIIADQSKDDIESREVTIMGDRELPYRLLKKVMATCTQADYGQVSLAVMQKAPEPAA